MNKNSSPHSHYTTEIFIQRILPCRRKSRRLHTFIYSAQWNDHPAYLRAKHRLGVDFKHADYLVDLYTNHTYRMTFCVGELGYRILMKEYDFQQNYYVG